MTESAKWWQAFHTFNLLLNFFWISFWFIIGCELWM